MVSRYKKGFTLIEIMIVIAIIGVLAAAALPNFNQARDRAITTKCYEFSTLLTETCEVYHANHAVEPKTLDDLLPFIGGTGKIPLCPRGGTYRFQTKTSDEDNMKVECTLHGCASATWGG